ncbi:hypothetical protein CKO_01529 [Citrobacter koseri ATCC BAA-895]|uniref:Uncharacterized protein n=1 Tax=Citrobacter koseri (strain ATCC BAA-895 / CDC 4225-83 / SGSC4696) TaxID=290338 RepID=A8AGP7_CITK8|nr:hypothetical protein CKO_01529 [Citrobacter koseri ATCC BAA-895]
MEMRDGYQTIQTPYVNDSLLFSIGTQIYIFMRFYGSLRNINTPLNVTLSLITKSCTFT